MKWDEKKILKKKKKLIWWIFVDVGSLLLPKMAKITVDFWVIKNLEKKSCYSCYFYEFNVIKQNI